MTVWRLCSCWAKMVLNRLWHQRGHSRLALESVEAFSRVSLGGHGLEMWGSACSGTGGQSCKLGTVFRGLVPTEELDAVLWVGGFM